MGIKAGSVNDFADSMAAAMEEALKDQWATLGRPALGDAGIEDRRLLFVAIARGVLTYLKNKEEEGLHLHTSVTFERPDPAGAVTETIIGLNWNLDDVA